MGQDDDGDRRRGDELVRRMLSLPPKPQDELKLGKRKRVGQPTTSGGREDESGPHKEDRPG